MRKVANSPNAACGFVRAMIYDPADGGGVWLFLFRSADDGPCDTDHWCEDATAAEERAEDDLGIRPADWTPIPDPRPGCQHDWLAPVRTVRDRRGVPIPGRFERHPG